MLTHQQDLDKELTALKTNFPNWFRVLLIFFNPIFGQLHKTARIADQNKIYKSSIFGDTYCELVNKGYGRNEATSLTVKNLQVQEAYFENIVIAFGINKKYEAAQHALSNQNYEAAKALFEESIEANYKKAESLFCVFNINLLLGNLDEAKKYAELIENNIQLISSLSINEILKPYVKLLSKLIDSPTPHPIFVILRALKKISLSDFRGAIEDVNFLFSLENHSPASKSKAFIMGFLCLLCNDMEQAGKHIEHLREMDSDWYGFFEILRIPKESNKNNGRIKSSKFQVNTLLPLLIKILRADKLISDSNSSSYLLVKALERSVPYSFIQYWVSKDLHGRGYPSVRYESFAKVVEHVKEQLSKTNLNLISDAIILIALLTFCHGLIDVIDDLPLSLAKKNDLLRTCNDELERLGELYPQFEAIYLLRAQFSLYLCDLRTAQEMIQHLEKIDLNHPMLEKLKSEFNAKHLIFDAVNEKNLERVKELIRSSVQRLIAIAPSGHDLLHYTRMLNAHTISQYVNDCYLGSSYSYPNQSATNIAVAYCRRHVRARMQLDTHFVGFNLFETGKKTLEKNKNPQKALEYFNESLKFNSNDADAYYQMGLAHRELRQPEAALTCFSKAIALVSTKKFNMFYSNIADTYYQIGLVQLVLELYQDAHESFDRAFQLNKELGKVFASDNFIVQMLENISDLYYKVDKRGYTLVDYATIYGNEIIWPLAKHISSSTDTFKSEKCARNYLESGGNSNFFGDIAGLGNLYETPITDGSTAGLSYLFKARKRIKADELIYYIDEYVALFVGNFESRLADKKFLDRVTGQLTAESELSKLFDDFKFAYLGNVLSLDGIVLDKHLQSLSGLNGPIFLCMRARILLEMIVTEQKLPGKLSFPKGINGLDILMQELADTLEILRVHRNVEACKDPNKNSNALRAAIAQNIMKQVALLSVNESYTVYGECADHGFYITFERINKDTIQIRIDNLGKESSYVVNGETIYRHPMRAANDNDSVKYFLPYAGETSRISFFDASDPNNKLILAYLETVLDSEKSDLYTVLYDPQFVTASTHPKALLNQKFRYRREQSTGNCVNKNSSVEQEKRLGLTFYRWFRTEEVKFLRLKELYKTFSTDPYAKREFMEIIENAKHYVANALEVLANSAESNETSCIAENASAADDSIEENKIIEQIEAEIAKADIVRLVKEAEESGYKPIHIAVLYGSPDRIVKIVAENPEALLEKTPTGKLPLDLACDTENGNMIRELIALAKKHDIDDIRSSKDSLERKISEIQIATSTHLIFSSSSHRRSHQTLAWEKILDPNEFASAGNNLAIALRDQYNIRDISFMAFIKLRGLKLDKNALINAGAIFTLTELNQRAKECLVYNSQTHCGNDPWNKHRLRRLIANIKSFISAYKNRYLAPANLDELKRDAGSRLVTMWGKTDSGSTAQSAPSRLTSQFKMSIIEFILNRHFENYDDTRTNDIPLLNALYKSTRDNCEIRENITYKNELRDQYVTLLIECFAINNTLSSEIYNALLVNLKNRIFKDAIPDSLKPLTKYQYSSSDNLDLIASELLKLLPENLEVREFIKELLMDLTINTPPTLYIDDLHKRAALLIFKNNSQRKYKNKNSLQDILDKSFEPFVKEQSENNQAPICENDLSLLFTTIDDCDSEKLKIDFKTFVLYSLYDMQCKLTQTLEASCKKIDENNSVLAFTK